jgi:cellulose synthase/poly-beta-1,6-N-acetylglucosamine synthase-like glycosyltransferase
LDQTGEEVGLSPGQSEEKSANDSQCRLHPFISIIVCTNGVRPTLNRCIELLAAQECQRFEIILVLNGPKNETFARDFAHFPVLLLNEPRRGVSNARNHAIPHAKGEILAFLDDDVVTEPNWLHELAKGFEDPAVACVTGRVIPAGRLYLASERAGRYYASERALTTWSLDASDPNWYQYILGEPVGFGCNMAFRKNFLENYSLFPRDLGAGSLIGGCDEFYMFVQVLKRGLRIRHVPTAAVTHVFEADISKQKVRDAQLYAGGVAFALKLLTEEKTLRWATLKWLLAGFRRRVHLILAQKTISSEPQELLSPREKLRAYLRGLGVFWKWRRNKDSAALRP